MADIHSAAAQRFGSSSSNQHSSLDRHTNQPLKYEAEIENSADTFSDNNHQPDITTHSNNSITVIQQEFPLKFEINDTQNFKNSTNPCKEILEKSTRDKTFADDNKVKIDLTEEDDSFGQVLTPPTDFMKSESNIDRNEEKCRVVSEVGKVLTAAASSIAKCEDIITDANEDFCDKTLVTVICKLKTIKNDISSIFIDLSKMEPSVIIDKDVKNVSERLVPIDDYLIKTELQEGVNEENFMDTFNDDEHSNQSENESEDPDYIQSEEKRKKSCKENFKDLLCSNCDEYCADPEEYKKHKRLCPSAGHHECDVCEKSFASAKSLTRHIVKRHPNVFYKCNVCGEEFKNKSELSDHREREKHVSDKKKWVCEFCSKPLTSKESYNYHISKFHSGNHVCSTCNLNFDDSKGLKEHMKDEHNTSKYNCTTCSKAFDTIPNLQKHMAEHGVWNCSHCNKEFMNEKALKGHIKNQHSQRYQCKDKECQEAFDSKWDMKRHYSANHAPPKKKICPTCGYTTNRATSLWRHVQSHGDPLHKCEVCGKPFHTKSQLQAHVRIHTGEKPYLCKECGSTFRTSSQLACHRFVHNGEKPYVCFLCHKAYSQRGNLKTHMKTHNSVH